MQADQIRQLLDAVKSGATSADDAFVALASLPFSDLGDAKVDHHRALRCGFAEVIFCRGKEPRDVVRIAEEALRMTPCILATRAEKRHIDALRERYPNAIVNARGGTVRIGASASMKTRGTVLVVTAGTSDIPVAEEALETLRAFGCEGYHCYDVGVAGLHRVLAALPRLREAAAIICIAGMEGALPSVVGGLVACPVIAVPTSIGYGASFNGAAALLGMLNTCAAGVTVVNIDNGFGAAISALRIIADRDWPIMEVPPKPVETIREEEIPLQKFAAKDEQFTRLEKAIEQFAALAGKPKTAEDPSLALNRSKIESDLISRLEKSALTLETLAAKPIVMEQPQGNAENLAHAEKLARLENAIAELSSIATKQRELAEKQSDEKSPTQIEIVARLEQMIETLAESIRNPKPETRNPILPEKKKSSVVKTTPKSKKSPTKHKR